MTNLYDTSLLNMEVMVKNTFVHVQTLAGNAPRAARRSGSAPAAMTRSADACAAVPKEKAQQDVWAEVPIEAGVEDVPTWLHDASTATGLSEDELEELESLHDEVTPKSGSSSSLRRAAAPRATAANRAVAPAAPPPAPAAEIPPRSRGKARSSADATPTSPGPADLLTQLAVVIAAASAALSGSSFVQECTKAQGARGWTMVVKMKPEHAKHRESVLSLAKDALLQAAKDSQCVYVLGYLAQPFVCSPLGFAAELGAEPEHTKACWSLLGQGFCRRGTACRRRHPKHQATLNVIVQQAVQRASS